jgi:hypothetical protein
VPGIEQDRERAGQLSADLVVLIEVELGEERLVAQSAGLVVAAFVAGSVAEQVEAVLWLGTGLGAVAIEDLNPTPASALRACSITSEATVSASRSSGSLYPPRANAARTSPGSNPGNSRSNTSAESPRRPPWPNSKCISSCTMMCC